ncbi:MAG: LytTR family transcriptional regulator [Saprospiraceae bacterium]|nr:LytTR family transcriptional regulator [Saprospiraceae bacterium]
MLWPTLRNKLSQPYPMHDETRWNWRMALGSGLFVLLFLFILQPFGSRVPAGKEWFYLRICAEYGLITSVVTLAWGPLQAFFPHFFKEEKWQVWKEIVTTLLFVSVIATANMLYAVVRFVQPLNWQTFAYWQFVTWAVGIFPTLYGVLRKQVQLMQRYAAEAADLTRQLHPSPPHPAEPALLLNGENQGESLQIHPDDLLCLAAADNYVQVFYRENGTTRQRLLRGALRRFEAALAPYPRFFRCHRTYVVNLDRVIRISGNAQGYKLHLDGLEQPVPVSRALNDEIRKRF